jgi:hypothetical protein
MVKEAKMTRYISAIALSALSLLTAFARPIAASDPQALRTSWSLIPESDRPHPEGLAVALPAFRAVTVTNCELSFAHSRRRWNVATGENESFNLPKGGKVKVDLEIARNADSIVIGSRSVKVKRDRMFGWRQAWLGWVDKSGMADEQENAVSEAFPLDLEPGDVLLFSVRFTKKPKLLGVERSEDLQRIDALSLSASCSTCGSRNAPCPSPVF